MMVAEEEEEEEEAAAVGRGRRRETGKHALLIKPWAWRNKGETKRLRRREPKIA
jgi:hypothetical protein